VCNSYNRNPLSKDKLTQSAKQQARKLDLGELARWNDQSTNESKSSSRSSKKHLHLLAATLVVCLSTQFPISRRVQMERKLSSGSDDSGTGEMINARFV
jgi:hypothetical protein